jgi:hypothetical protein
MDIRAETVAEDEFSAAAGDLRMRTRWRDSTETLQRAHWIVSEERALELTERKRRCSPRSLNLRRAKSLFGKISGHFAVSKWLKLTMP